MRVYTNKRKDVDEGNSTLDKPYKKEKTNGSSRSYAFLETINRKRLDFDFEKICSVTLSPLKVHCCLVCGKYFQGIWENSPAFLHSVDENHHVFINIHSLKVFLLPSAEEVIDQNEIQVISSIRYAIEPKFTVDELKSFPRVCRHLNNKPYINGFVGLNNSYGNGSINVILMLLAHVPPLRDHLLLLNTDDVSPLIRKLSVIIKKIWSVNLFKQHVSVDEFVSFVSVNYKNSIIYESDPRAVFIWLINLIVKDSQKMKSLLGEYCQGIIEIKEVSIKPVKDSGGNLVEFAKEESKEKIIVAPFWLLTLDLPPRPLFKDGISANSLPQSDLADIIKKYAGNNEHQLPHCVRKYLVKKSPKYMVLHYDRFDKKDLTPIKNRNQTLVKFPMQMQFNGSPYSLIANVVHETIKQMSTGTAEVDLKSHWKIQIYNSKSDQWSEIDGSNVRIKDKELLFLNESYLQIWEKMA